MRRPLLVLSLALAPLLAGPAAGFDSTPVGTSGVEQATDHTGSTDHITSNQNYVGKGVSASQRMLNVREGDVLGGRDNAERGMPYAQTGRPNSTGFASGAPSGEPTVAPPPPRGVSGSPSDAGTQAATGQGAGGRLLQVLGVLLALGGAIVLGLMLRAMMAGRRGGPPVSSAP